MSSEKHDSATVDCQDCTSFSEHQVACLFLQDHLYVNRKFVSSIFWNISCNMSNSAKYCIENSTFRWIWQLWIENSTFLWICRKWTNRQELGWRPAFSKISFAIANHVNELVGRSIFPCYHRQYCCNNGGISNMKNDLYRFGWCLILTMANTE